MANRVKEDEKNERIIRSLLKVTENRRCINCNSLGPQYVCTNFWTFVCTTCSGIHREFTHRVKSISMAKFTSQEVTALQGGGNMRAKEIYFKEWDPQRNSAPDSSNIERLRDFIKHVYVDRRYTGERSIDKPPRAKTGEDSYENRRTDTFEGSRSPPYERGYNDRPSPGGRSDDSNSRYTYDERRSPGYDRENRQYGVRPEIVNDWNREDRFGNGRRSEERRVSDVDSRSEGRSPDRQKDLDMSSPPMVRPVRDILGDNVSPLRIIGPPKPNGGRVADGSTYAQRSASSNSLASSNGNPVELKSENPVISLIDFDADPEPPVPSTLPQTQQSATVQSIAQPISSSVDNNWASFDFVTEVKVSQPPSNVNTLESALSELLVPASVPTHLPGMHNPSVAMETAPMSNISVSPVNSAQSTSGQWASVHPPNSLFPATAAQPTSQQFTPFGGDSTNQFTPFGGDSQPWNLSPTLNTQGQTSTHTTQAPPAISKLAQASGVVSQPLPVAEKTTGRKALPEDIFAAMYPAMPSPQPGWQTGPPAGMGFNMQYNTAVPVPVYPPSLKSTNPFDLNSGPAPPVQAPTFPSMASLQGALPNMAPPTSLLRTSSLGTPPSTWMPPQPGTYQSAMPPQPGAYQSTLPPQPPSYQSALPSQPPSYPSAMPLSTYMGQHMPNNMAVPRHPGGGGFGNEQAGFGSVYSNQQIAGRYSAPATPSTFSPGGNPFG